MNIRVSPSPFEAAALERPASTLHVFYDGDCVICRAVRRWIEKQAPLLDVVLLPYQSARACEVFPPLDRLHPDKNIMVLTNTGRLFKGAEACLVCLDALRDYRRIARDLAQHPRLLALARHLWHLLSWMRRFRPRMPRALRTR